MPKIKLDIRTATLIVAASDSLHHNMADYVCDGINDHVEIQAALDALPATGGEVLLLDGTYNCEVTINLDSNQTLRGCGKNTILTTSTANLTFLSAVGGAGTEKTGIVIADLQIDGGAGTVSNNGIYFEYVDYSLIENVYSRRHDPGMGTGNGIFLWSSDHNIINENMLTENYFGIHLYDSADNHIINNHCYINVQDGIYLDDCSYNIISGNMCEGTSGTNGDGLALDSACHYNIITHNTCKENHNNGIALYSNNDNNVITDNLCIANSQETTNTSFDIRISGSSYNNIQDNTCRAGALANKPKYGINISNAACTKNLVANNDLYNDGFGTAPFNDAGTGTKLNTYKVPFSNGSDPQDSGFLIDANTEYARAWLRLPDKVVQVVRMKVYARSVVAEADKMRGEFVVFGGADNEAFNTHNGSVANHPSTSSNFGADDVIFWTLATAGVLALLGGDSVEVKVLHEAAGNGDCATNAYLRTVEIEYV